MISKIKLQTRTFLFTCTISIILVCSLIFALVPSKALAAGGIDFWSGDIPSSVQSVIDYANNNYPAWSGAGRRYAIFYTPDGCFGGQYCQTNHDVALLFSISENSVNTQNWNGKSLTDSLSIQTLWGTNDYFVYNNSIIDLNGSAPAIYIQKSGDSLPFFNPIPANDVSYIAPIGSSSYIIYNYNIPSYSTINFIPDSPTPPPYSYFPIQPITHYLVSDRTVTADCFDSKFFSDDENNYSLKPETCSFFLDYSSTDSSNNNEVFYTGLDEESTISNVLNSDPDSSTHIASATGRTVINYVELNNGKAILNLPYPVDFGTYYLKTLITTNNGVDSKSSVVVTEIKFNGGVVTGNSISGDYIPSLYDDCSEFDVLSGDWFSCSVHNIGTWVTESLKSFFVPDLTSLRSQLAFKRDDVIQKSGFLGQSFYAIIDFFTSAIESSNSPSCSLNFGTIFNGQATVSFDVCSFEDSASTLFSAFQNIIIITTLITFLFASYRAVLKLFKGDE